VSVANSASPGASMPHQNTRGERGLGKKPTLRSETAIGERRGNPSSAVRNSGSRSGGHSPMNLVVMCKLPVGLHPIAAVGLSLSINRLTFSSVPGSSSRAVNSRMNAHCICAKMVIVRFGPILTRAFYERPTLEVARDLVGKVLVHGAAAGIIVETEAYPGRDDLASHSARGITDRTKVIFGPPGHAYVYLIYGMYECLNLVAEPDGQPGCVLLRAIEPVSGIGLMRRRRPPNSPRRRRPSRSTIRSWSTRQPSKRPDRRCCYSASSACRARLPMA